MEPQEIHLTQIEQLLRPINPDRVKQKQGKFAYLETWDVIAHMDRIFGPLGWDKTVVDLQPLFQSAGENGKHSVAYRATVRVTVHTALAHKISEDVAVGSALNQPGLADAHDLALKSAVSDAFKRACKDLGNQFGLSLYNNGSTASVVRTSLAHPEARYK